MTGSKRGIEQQNLAQGHGFDADAAFLLSNRGMLMETMKTKLLQKNLIGKDCMDFMTCSERPQQAAVGIASAK